MDDSYTLGLKSFRLRNGDFPNSEEIDNPETLLWLKKSAQSGDVIDQYSSYDGCLAAVRALTKNYKDAPETLPFLKNLAQYDGYGGEDYYYYVCCSSFRSAVVKEVAQIWNNDSNTLLWLKSFTHSKDRYSDYSIRITAVQELAKGWRNDPETLPWLKSIATDHYSYQVRYAALQEIVSGWKDDPKALPWLKRMGRLKREQWSFGQI